MRSRSGQRDDGAAATAATITRLRELRRVSEDVALDVIEHEVILRGACERCLDGSAR